MAFADTYYKMAGVEKEQKYFPILKNLFEKIGDRQFFQSNLQENREHKIDFYTISLSGKKVGFDLKTSSNPNKHFCLTYKMNGTDKNIFEVGMPNIITIFLLEHTNEFAFVYKNKIAEWFNMNTSKCYPCKTKDDNSTWFFFYTADVIKLADKIVKIETI